MARCGGDFGTGLENSAAIAAPSSCARCVARGGPAYLATACGFTPSLQTKKLSKGIVPAGQPAKRGLLGAPRPVTRSERGAFAARVRRASLQRPTTGRRTTTIERIIDWPARVAVVECVAPVPSPQAAIDIPYPAWLGAAASGQESRAALGRARNASVNSTLNALQPACSFHRFPPPTPWPTAPATGYLQNPIWRNTRPPAKSNIPHPNKGVGTIDDKTGNYCRAPGTIEDDKKRSKTQEKPALK